MSLVLNVPEPGQLVDVRQRRYVIVDVAQSVLPPDLLKSGSLSTRLQPQQGQHLVTLTWVEVPISNFEFSSIGKFLLGELINV